MNRRGFILLALALYWLPSVYGWTPKAPRECRLAFLMGMTEFTGEQPAISIFPAADDPAYAIFERVARLYAADLGVTDEELRAGLWREKVVASISKHYRQPASHKTIEELFGARASVDSEVEAAYLAGAYSRSGTPSGLRLVNQRKGLYLVWLVRRLFVDLTVEATLRPGIPGNITISVRDGGQQTAQGFIEELEKVREGLSTRK